MFWQNAGLAFVRYATKFSPLQMYTHMTLDDVENVPLELAGLNTPHLVAHQEACCAAAVLLCTPHPPTYPHRQGWKRRVQKSLPIAITCYTRLSNPQIQGLGST